MSVESGSGIDIKKVMAEIDEEVQRRRRSGEIPADLERELDLVFARYAPVGAVSGDFDQVMARVEHQTFMDVHVPIESSKAPIAATKRVIRKTMRWYIRYLADQVTEFANAITKAMRLLSDRVRVLEAANVSPKVDIDVREQMDAGLPDSEYWHPLVTNALAGVNGRVLHAEAGDGALLAQLTGNGIDAYGIDPSSIRVADGAQKGLDLREGSTREHFESLPDRGLAAVVLSGVTDRHARGALVELAALAARKLQQNGVIVIVSSEPASWARTRSSVVADLSGGRPFHADTWSFLLERAGFNSIEIISGPVEEGLLPLHDAEGSFSIVDANFQRLSEAMFGPSSYMITARQDRP